MELYRQPPECKFCAKRVGVRKHGKSRTNLQRYLCTSCGKTFQIDYIYQAYQIEMKQKIKQLYLKGESITNICNDLGVRQLTVRRSVAELEAVA
ncbi:MAG: hypothetical protein LBN41_11445 [Enterobacteriaceae bacterium]|jgi:transposase-like protein|nr:hypothetical protein [Enterobacteriaceae bacterium]